jgi:hypothetical protein
MEATLGLRKDNETVRDRSEALDFTIVSSDTNLREVYVSVRNDGVEIETVRVMVPRPDNILFQRRYSSS